jgi:PAS domain S-box-containing protein
MGTDPPAEPDPAADRVLAALQALGVVVYGFRVEGGGLPLDFVGPGLDDLLGRRLPDDLVAVAGLWAEGIHRDDRAREAAFMARLGSGEETSEVYRVVQPDGTVRRVWERGVPVAGPDGTTTVVSAVVPAPDGLPGSGDGAAEPGGTLSATAYTAERVDARLVEVRVGDGWEHTTGLGREPDGALAALAAAAHPDDRDLVRERERLLLAGIAFEGVFRVVDRDGRLRWLSERTTPVQRGDRPYVEGVIVDVSGEHPLFDDVTSLDARLRWLLQAVDAHVYTLVVDADEGGARAEFLGPRLDVIYGSAPPPHLDIDALWASSLHPDDRRALEARWARLMRGEPASVAYRVRGVDGEERWIRDDARPRRGGDGRLRIDGIATRLDPGQVEAAESRRAARVLAELHDTVFEYELTPDGWTAAYASTGIARLLGGAPPGDRDARDVILERLHPDDRDLYLAQHDELSAGRPVEVELRLVGFDGRVRRVAIRAQPLRSPGGALRAVGVATVVGEAASPQAADTSLTGRQLEVLALLAQGQSTEAIAGQLFISPATVRNHVTAILAELGAHSRLEAVAEARRRLLI